MASSPASSVTATNSRDKAGDSKVVDEKRHGGIEDVLPNAKDLKAKDTQVVKKKRWWLKAPREPFASFDDAPIIPLATASWFSRITFLCAVSFRFATGSSGSPLTNRAESSQGSSRC